MVTAPTVRPRLGGRVPWESARCTTAAPTAAAGGGMRGTVSTLRLPAGLCREARTRAADRPDSWPRHLPDFSSELVPSAVNGGIEWGGWDWHHYVDGSPSSMRSVTIVVVSEALVAEARLDMESVEADGGDIQAAVEELYRPPSLT